MIEAIAWRVGGAVLLAVLGVDAFVTVLHPSSGAGPYTSLQNRLIWATARALARALPRLRTRILAVAAPVMAVATPAAWLLLLTAGLGFVYLPAVSSFPVQPPAGDPDWAVALYLSGYLTTTLGLGDVVPDGILWRWLAVSHAAAGFALLSASITYILTIYRRHSDDSALGLHIRHSFGDPAWRERYGPHESRGELLSWQTLEIARRLADVNVAHRQYPILHYFHDDPSNMLAVQVGRLLELVETLEAEAGRDPALRPLRRALEAYFDQMPFDTGSEGGLDDRYRRLLRAHELEGENVDGIRHAGSP